MTHTIFVKHKDEIEYRKFDDLSEDEKEDIRQRINHNALTVLGYEPVRKEG